MDIKNRMPRALQAPVKKFLKEKTFQEQEAKPIKDELVSDLKEVLSFYGTELVALDNSERDTNKADGVAEWTDDKGRKVKGEYVHSEGPTLLESYMTVQDPAGEVSYYQKTTQDSIDYVTINNLEQSDWAAHIDTRFPERSVSSKGDYNKEKS